MCDVDINRDEICDAVVEKLFLKTTMNSFKDKRNSIMDIFTTKQSKCAQFLSLKKSNCNYIFKLHNHNAEKTVIVFCLNSSTLAYVYYYAVVSAQVAQAFPLLLLHQRSSALAFSAHLFPSVPFLHLRQRIGRDRSQPRADGQQMTFCSQRDAS